MTKQTTTGAEPRVAVSNTSTMENRTGSWKYIRPVYQDKVAPCNARCPVGIDIEAYMNLLREGQSVEAREILLQENPLPAITGRVCDHPCENACSRRQFDAPVAIHSVERWLGDMILEELPQPAAVRHAQNVGIVGSGPAGLSCAYHLTLLGYPVTVIEAFGEAGGMLRLGIPEFRLPRAVLDRQLKWLENLGIEFRLNTVVGEDMTWDELGHFDAVFLATGAHRGRRIGFDDEAGPGFVSGLDFLKAVNGGARPNIGKDVVVVGGGNTAIDCARTALRLGADPLILYRRTRAEMPAIEQEIQEAETEGVRFQFLAAPVDAIRGDHGLEAIECQRMRLGEADDSGRRRPVPVEGDTFRVPAETVIKAIGELAELDYLPPEIKIEGNAVAVSEMADTNKYWVFAGGDMTDDTRSVAFAIGAGKRAAMGIDRLFRPDDWVADDGVDRFRFADGNASIAKWRSKDSVRRAAPVNRVVGFEELNVNHFRHVARNEDRERLIQECLSTFTEVNQGLAPEDAKAEANRCFNCGVCNGCEMCLILCPDVAISHGDAHERFHIDMEHCKGCGICAEECPRGAMAMTREGL